VLTQLTSGGTSHINSVAKLGNGSVQFLGTGIPALVYSVLASAAVWSIISLHVRH
jgi:hypothetical protein